MTFDRLRFPILSPLARRSLINRCCKPNSPSCTGRALFLDSSLVAEKKECVNMEWLERLLGGSEYRRYGENEYYEYPRNGVRASGGGVWEIGPELEPSNEWSWRGPSIFEDPNANMDQDMYFTKSISCDTSKYVSQYGSGTAETYNPTCDSRSYRTEDYDTRSDILARGLQESLSLDQYPVSYGTPASTTKSVGMSTCAGCHRALGYGRFMTCRDQNWHPSCFNCKACRKAIEDKCSMHGSDPYHRNCYKELFHPKCEICYNHIPLNAQGRIEYSSHPFWNQKHCPSHERDGSTCCCICNRIEAIDQRYENLGDGRKACSECMESAVMTTKKCQPLYREILKFYRTNLGMPIEQEVPMLVVKREALNNAQEIENNSHAHVPETRGLCLSEEQIFPVRPPNSLQDTRVLEHGSKTEMRKLTRRCEVTAILVLYGLPRLLTGSILAHELMHAWIRLDGRFPDLENGVEEGICQVIAHMWLKAELESMARRSYCDGRSSSIRNQRLGEFFLHQIETDSSPIYGDGFRMASASVAKYGLPRTLHHLRQTGEILR